MTDGLARMDPQQRAQWTDEMKLYAPHICWATNGVSACLLDTEHEGRHSWEPKENRAMRRGTKGVRLDNLGGHLRRATGDA